MTWGMFSGGMFESTDTNLTQQKLYLVFLFMSET